MAYYHQRLIALSAIFFSFLIPSAYAQSSLAVDVITPPAMHFAFSDQPLTGKEPKLDKHSYNALMQATKLLKSKQTEAAITELKLAIAQKPNAALWYSLAQIQQQQQNYPAAQVSLKKALELLPAFARAHQALGALLTRLGHYGEARTHLTQALSNQASAYIYSLLGYGYLQQKNYLAAQMAYQQAMVLDASNPQHQRGVLQAAIASNDTSLAQAVLTPLLTQNPDAHKLWQLKANLALKQQNYTDASAALEVANRLKNCQQNQRLLAQLYLKQQQFNLAQPYLLQFASNPTSTDLELLSNALSYMENSAPTKQTKALLTQLWKVPQLPANAKSQLYFTSARLALKQQQFAKAKKQLNQSIQLNSQNGQALMLLASLERNTNSQRAEMLYSRAESLDEFRVQAKVAHAQLLIRKQAYPRAHRLLKEVLKIKPAVRKHMENLALVERLMATTQG